MIHAVTRCLPALVLAAALSACSATPPYEDPDNPTPVAQERADQVSRTELAPQTAIMDIADRAAGDQGDRPRILAMGDSMMAWHGAIGKSIPDVIAETLDAEVASHAVSGARVIYRLPLTGAMGMNIGKQFRDGGWDWVVMNGGGNDLWLGCGCMLCDRKMDRLISKDGATGAIPEMVARARASNARVIYLGYLRSPGVGSPIEYCKDEGDELDARLARMAEAMDGVYFLPMSDLVPFGDRSYHALDMIHPSIKASREIGQRVAALMTELDS